MQYTGMFGTSGKWVNVRYNPGWGEPGEWYLQFSDGNEITIDNVEAFKGQEEYLGYISEDKYRDEVIWQNWAGVGNSDDVIRRVLEFVGYNDASRNSDVERLEANKLVVFEMAQQIVDGMTLDGLSKVEAPVAPSFQSLISDAQSDAGLCLQRIHIYDSLKQGREVGIGWSNESFLRDLPDSPYAPRVKQIMKEMRDLFRQGNVE